MQSWSEISYEELVQVEILQTIVFSLIVPTKKEVQEVGRKLDLSKSDLNVCYSKPEVNPGSGEKQSWFDVKLTVQGEYDLPSEKEWFYVVAEEGYYFKACFSGKKIKKLVSLNNPKILGIITKGALIESEVIYRKINFTSEDPKGKGIITKEMLEEYGGSEVILKKTNMTKEDRRGNKRDIGLIDFPYKPGEPNEEGYRRVNEIIQESSEEL